MAAVGIGLGFQALFVGMEPKWIPKAIATAFLATAVFILIAAERRSTAVMRRLQPHEVQTFRLVNVRLITISLVIATLSLAVAIWTLEIKAGTL